MRFRQRTETGFRRANVRARAALRLSALGRSRGAIGSTASRPATRCVFRSPFARCRTKAGDWPPRAERNGPLPQRFATACRVRCCCSCSCSRPAPKGPRPTCQYISEARSLGAEWALVNEQAGKGQVTPTYAHSMHQWLREQPPDGIVRADPARLALRRRDSQRCLQSPTMPLRPSCAPTPTRLKQIEDSLESA